MKIYSLQCVLGRTYGTRSLDHHLQKHQHLQRRINKRRHKGPTKTKLELQQQKSSKASTYLKLAIYKIYNHIQLHLSSNITIPVNSINLFCLKC